MLCALLLIALGAGLAGAQPRLGDLVLNEKKPLGHVVSLDRSTGLLATIVKGPISTNRAILGLTMARNNTDMYLLEEGGPGFYLWSIAPNGKVTTVMPVSASGEGAPTSCDVLQEGNLVVSSAVYQARDYLRVVDPIKKTYSSLYTANPSKGYYYSVRQNQDNGNLLVTQAFGNELLELDWGSNTLRTVRTGLGTTNAIDVHPATGNYYCGGSSRVYVISPQGAQVGTINARYARRIRVEPQTGRVICLTGTSSSAVNTIVEFDAQGTALKTHGPFTGYNFTGLDIYGSRQITGSGPATPGSAYDVDFSFPGGGNVPYVAALSFGQRPGINLQGSTLNLAPDALFWLSIQGFFVNGFQGVLDGSGRASGRVNIPAFAPKGLTIFCSVVATNGITFLTGNTIGITIR
jgi:hypothetical protein